MSLGVIPLPDRPERIDVFVLKSSYDRLQAENAKLREQAARAWRLFTENGAVHPSDLSEVDAVRDGLRELGVEVD